MCVMWKALDDDVKQNACLDGQNRPNNETCQFIDDLTQNSSDPAEFIFIEAFKDEDVSQGPIVS